MSRIRVNKVRVDSDGFVNIDGFRPFRVTPAGELEFKDKSRHRSQQRGGELLVVSISALAKAVEEYNS